MKKSVDAPNECSYIQSMNNAANTETLDIIRSNEIVWMVPSSEKAIEALFEDEIGHTTIEVAVPEELLVLLSSRA